MSRVNGALYPFGHGLSYTSFAYSDLELSPRVITPHQKATVSLSVTNTGTRAGDEVVQLYIRDELSSVTTYEKNLAGFERVHLLPGETRRISFTIDRKHLELLNSHMEWVVEPGEFTLMAAASSEDIRLSSTLKVVSYGKELPVDAPGSMRAVTASTNAEQLTNLFDEDLSTVWEGNKGDYITFALPNDSHPAKVRLAFRRDTRQEAEFEIQLSGGGGQFLTVFSGTVSEFEVWKEYDFPETVASDLRIVLGSDRVGIAGIRLKELN